jgi:hypothetical protein
MAHRPRQATEPDEGSEPEPGPKLEPVRTVKRELISPAGHKVLVDVPVYPPFRLEGRPEKKPPERRRNKAGRRSEGDSGSS